ncbi:MAG: response regulator [Beijerinckiaceae bacterium]|nr:response regulator [Beijerinckiaceae bacterium]
MIFPGRNKADAGRADSTGVNLFKLVVALTILLPSIAFGVAAWTSYDRFLREARARIESRVELAHQHAQRVFATFDLAAAQTEEFLLDHDDESIVRQGMELSSKLARLGSALPEVEDIWVLDPKGQPVLTGAQTPAPWQLNFADRDYFKAQVKSNAGTYVSERLVGRLRPVQIFELSYRRRSPTDAFRGIIGISADPRFFERFYTSMLGEDVTALSLVRADGSVLARSPALPTPMKIRDSSPLLRMQKEQPMQGFYRDVSQLDGVERMAAYRRLEHLPVYVVGAQDMSIVIGHWRSAMAQHLYFGIPATFAMFLIAMAAVRQAREQAHTLQALREEGERRAFAEEALRQANKLEAIGRLTGGVAHDFNNLLQVMLGRLARIQKAAQTDAPPATRDVEAMQFAIDRAATLTHRLLAFSRQQPLRVEVVDVNKLVSGMVELVRQTAGNEIAVETVYAAGLWSVIIDANQLENALLNITSNARDAMGGVGRITIETANSYLDDAYVREYPGVKAGQYVSVSISDTGQGISRDVLAKIFEPFFTTKPIGQGTGLGLSMVYGFVRQSDGHVAVYSEEGQGTTVRLYLPRHFGPVDEATVPDVTSTSEMRGSGLVLVVEDEVEVRNLVVDTLTDLGYSTIAGADAHEGLRLLDQNPDIQLLLTDVGLPDGMNGRQLADAAAMRRPDLPIVFMTGYARNAIVHHGRLDPGVELLTKPFTRKALAAKVRETLARQKVES